ncbi:MAG TPA: polysaccharide biosynthesis/export family protein [Bryobacteraceae bacterium]
MIRSGYGFVVFCTVLAAQSLLAQKTTVTKVPDDLAEYIQLARSLGLTNDQLRANALKNGYKPNLVDEALKSLPATKDAKPDEDRGVGGDYVIGESDVLGVAVYKEQDASVPSVQVRADGKVSLPFIKDVGVAGLTCAEAEKIITAKLMPYFNSPDVSVYVREVHSKKIFLVGAFRKNGPVELKYPMRVLQAVIEAGGPNEFAKTKKMYITRTERGSQFRIEFDYKSLLRGEHPELNVWVRPGDYIYADQ